MSARDASGPLTERSVEPSALRPLHVRLLAFAALSAFVVPLLLQAFGNGAGSYSMFTQPVLYRVRVALTLEDGSRRRVPMTELKPHMGRDAQRVVGQAADWFVGETQLSLMATHQDDLGTLACRLQPRAAQSTVQLERDTVGHKPLTRTQVKVDCHEARR